MVMEFNKEWYKSKTVWAAAFSLVITVASAIAGESNPFVAMLVAAGSAVGLYGRYTANTKLE